MSVQALHLMAQIRYRQKRSEETVRLYEMLLEVEEADPDSCTNLFAAYVMSNSSDRISDPRFKSMLQEEEETYELAFNVGCAFVQSLQFSEAVRFLKHSLELCYQSLEGESEDIIQDDSAIIRAQLAFCEQIQGNVAAARRGYLQILQHKVTDPVVESTVVNNLISLKKSREMFDSIKRIKKMLSSEVRSKLSPHQLAIALFNYGVLLAHTGQVDDGHAFLCGSSLGQGLDDPNLRTLVEASFLFREHKFEECISLLKERYSAQPLSSVGLSLAQVLLEQGKSVEAVELLEQEVRKENRSVELAGALAKIYLQALNQPEKAVEVLTSCANHWRSENVEVTKIILVQVGKIQLQSGLNKDAAATYEALVALDPSDKCALADLVVAYSLFDVKEAEKFISKLDTVPFDPLTRESVELLIQRRHMSDKKASALQEDSVPRDALAADKNSQKKKRKARKNKPPKNPGGKIDPERWIPLKDRSYYRARKSRKGKGTNASASSGGSQGAGAAVDRSATMSIQMAEPSAASSSSSGRKKPLPAASRRKGGRKH